MQNSANRFPGDTSPGPDANTNQRIIVLTGMSLAVSLVFASFYPTPLVAAVFSNLALIAAAVSSVMALMRMQSPLGETLNLWDHAAILALVSLGAAMFIDTEAVKAFIEANASASGATEQAVSPASGKP